MPSAEETNDPHGQSQETTGPMNSLVRLPQSLGQRVITAAVAGALVVGGIFMLSPVAIAAVAGVVVLAAGWEWARLAGLASWPARSGYVLVLAIAAAWLWQSGAVISWFVLGVAALWWLGFALWLACGGHARGSSARPWAALVLGLVALPALLLGIVSLAGAAEGRGVLLYALCLVWAADIGAYFAGRAWGRRPLAPRISAGKTWEGLVGGLAAVGLYALVCAWLLGVPGGAWLGWIALALVAGAVSVAGDLFESLLKRAAGVKDSGALLPGHGGLLDRIDSLIAAMPIMALGLSSLPLEVLP